MPLLERLQHENAEIIIWHITEAEEFFVEKLGFGSDRKDPKRRLEHLAGRFLLLELWPQIDFSKISISSTGKPFLNGAPKHFSVSHSYPYAAAAISQNEVGVDIQVYQPKICNLQQKFLSDAEALHCQHDMALYTLAWSAKEALFKKYGLGAVDFKGDMPIQHLSGNNPYEIDIAFRKESQNKIGFGQLFDEFSFAVF